MNPRQFLSMVAKAPRGKVQMELEKRKNKKRISFRRRSGNGKMRKTNLE